jgi:thiamine-monophosphate kinase
MTEKNEQKVHAIAETGKYPLIEYLTNKFIKAQPSTFLDFGDDAAVINPDAKKILLTTDSLSEGVHFNFVYTPIKHLGYKVVVAGISDIIAMNAKPTQIMIALSVSGKFSKEALGMLYEGIHLACERYKVDLIGGDITSSVTGMHISVTAIGEAEDDCIVKRDGAKEHDLICVSGNLGAAYMGLQVLERERKIFQENPKIQPELSGYDYILERQLKPEARDTVLNLLEDKNILPTSMIDITNGLASEMIQICNSSKTGCKIFEDKIPIDVETQKAAEEMNIEPYIAALNGGEDYELLFTVPVDKFDQLKDVAEISVIGHITDPSEGNLFISKEGGAIELKAQGWAE